MNYFCWSFEEHLFLCENARFLTAKPCKKRLFLIINIFFVRGTAISVYFAKVPYKT